MNSDQAAEVRRAREVLNTCGWVFDTYRGRQMTVMMSDEGVEVREQAYVKARIVSEIQAELQSLVENWDFDRAEEIRRERRREGRNAID